MKIKVKVEDKSAEDEIIYPCLMKSHSSNSIYYMTGRKKGIRIKSGFSDIIDGGFSETLDMGILSIFKGKITLENVSQ